MASLLRPVLFLLAVALACGAPPLTAVVSAHPLAPSLLEIVEDAPGHAQVRWKTPATKMPGAEMRPLLSPQCLRSRELGVQSFGTALVQNWEVACDAPLAESVVEVDGIAASRANVILRMALADGRVFNTVLSAEQPAFVVPLREQPLAVVRSYLLLGIEHILTGFDHLLFVFGLMLLVADRRQLVLTVTAFTGGHSVTLSVAVLGFVAVPSGTVEALIAFSILLLAVELARAPNAAPAMMRRFPWIMAFAFGLLHGFGFAGALAEIGLSTDEIPLALLSFNLGIEAGQLIFCAGVLGLYAALHYLGLPRFAREPRIAAYAIGSLAAFWLIERAAASW